MKEKAEFRDSGTEEVIYEDYKINEMVNNKIVKTKQQASAVKRGVKAFFDVIKYFMQKRDY